MALSSSEGLRSWLLTGKTDSEGRVELAGPEVEIPIGAPALFVLQIDAVVRTQEDVWDRLGGSPRSRATITRTTTPSSPVATTPWIRAAWSFTARS